MTLGCWDVGSAQALTHDSGGATQAFNARRTQVRDARMVYALNTAL